MIGETSSLNTVARFLARRDAESLAGVAADLLVLLGSALPGTARFAADALRAGIAPRVLISGGIGHSTSLLWEAVCAHPVFGKIPVSGRSEADILRDVMVEFLSVEPGQILIENRSTNCGANAWESKRALSQLGLNPRSVLLVQDPTMQRRTHASFERAYRGESSPTFISYSPFIPEVREGALVEDFPDGQWAYERFVDLVLGEIPRLRDDDEGYGPRGKDFIEHVDIPEEVLAAYEELRKPSYRESSGLGRSAGEGSRRVTRCRG